MHGATDKAYDNRPLSERIRDHDRPTATRAMEVSGCDANYGGPRRDIGWAIKQMWNGQKVTRCGWNGRGQHLALQVPDHNSKMSLPYIYIKTVQGDLVPWLASQTDLLATDWLMYEAD